MINGQWLRGNVATNNEQGQFVRQDSQFLNEINEQVEFFPEPHRYHLYVSYACPWANRCLIMLYLKGLEDTISYSAVSPWMLDNGWEFGEAHESLADPIYGHQYLYELYQKAAPQYSGKVTVPVLWDKKKQTIVNNESSKILRILNNSFNNYARNQTDYYPKAHREAIDKINAFIYSSVNNGVYQVGFAKSQTAYEQAFDR